MTGKNMLLGIQNLDADIIEEAEFGAFQEKHNSAFRKKALLIALAAAMLIGALTGAAAFTRWSNSVQFQGQPSQQIKEQAEKSGLSTMLEATKAGADSAISATDNGITVTAVQTLADQNGACLVFRIDGFDLPEGKFPWAWWDLTIDGKAFYGSWGTQFFDGITFSEDGSLIYAKNGKSVSTVDGSLVPDYLGNDGSIEFTIDLDFEYRDGRYLGKEIQVTFTGFGIQGERFEDEEIRTAPGTWTLNWILEGSSVSPRKWAPNAQIGDWDVTLLEAEIGQRSVKTTYRLGKEYPDLNRFHEATGWDISPWGVRMKDGTDVTYGGSGESHWDPVSRVYTVIEDTGYTILDPDQIAGMFFYSGYELNEQGYRVDLPYDYIPFE